MSNSTTYPAQINPPETIQTYQWCWREQTVAVAYQTMGNGAPILLLPSFSTVSSRTEMSGLAKYLIPHFQVTSIDFPGFGDSDRSSLDYSPALYRQFLSDFLRDIYSTPVTIVAAGHAAGYAIAQAARVPNSIAKLILVAPTWRGPLPTMVKGHKPWLKLVRDLIRTPIIGQFLYQLNTTPGFLSFMYRRHVYADPTSLTADLLQEKRALTQQPNARFGAGAFVTGGLDPYVDRATVIADLQSLTIPVTIAIGTDSPPKSKAEMLALSQVSRIASFTLPGTLGLHEEYPLQLYTVIQPFL